MVILVQLFTSGILISDKQMVIVDLTKLKKEKKESLWEYVSTIPCQGAEQTSFKRTKDISCKFCIRTKTLREGSIFLCVFGLHTEFLEEQRNTFNNILLNMY